MSHVSPNARLTQALDAMHTSAAAALSYGRSAILAAAELGPQHAHAPAPPNDATRAELDELTARLEHLEAADEAGATVLREHTDVLTEQGRMVGALTGRVDNLDAKLTELDEEACAPLFSRVRRLEGELTALAGNGSPPLLERLELLERAAQDAQNRHNNLSARVAALEGAGDAAADAQDDPTDPEVYMTFDGWKRAAAFLRANAHPDAADLLDAMTVEALNRKARRRDDAH